LFVMAHGQHKALTSTQTNIQGGGVVQW